MKASAPTDPRDPPSPDAAGLFRAIFEQAAVGVAQVETATGRFLRVNQRYADIVGCSRAEMERLDFQTLTHPDDLAANLDNLRRLVTGELREFTMEQRYRRKDGTVVWVNLTVSPLWAPGEPPRSHIAVVEDITIRKQMAAEVQHHSQQLQLLSQAAQQINARLEVPVILRQLVAAALELTGAESGAAGLLLEGRMVFTEYHQQGRLLPIDYRFDPGHGVPGWVMETRSPYLSSDAEHDPHVVPEIQQALGFRTLADVPILSRTGELLGCFEIHNKADHREFTAQDVELLQGLAASAAVALENARLLAERKRAEEAVRESELRYRTLADSGQALIWASGPDKKCDYFNQPWLTFTGRSLEQELGDGWAEGVHPDDLPRCLEIYTCAFDRREPFSMDYRLRRHDGEFRWIQDDGTPRYDSQGTFLGYIGHCLDVTERKQAEDKLRRSERQLSEAQFIARLGRWEWDLLANVTDWSSELYDIFGITPDTLVPNAHEAFLNCVHPLDRERVAQVMEQALANKESFATEYRIVRLDGLERVIHARGRVLLDGHGQVVRMHGSSQDITERTRAEQALEASRRRLELALQGGRLGIWDWDPQTGAVAYSDLWAQMLEYRPDEVEPTVGFFERHVHPEDLPAVLDRLTGHVEGRLPVYQSEHRLRTKSGRWIWVLDRGEVAERSRDGRAVRVTGVISDITERKRAEQALRGSEERYRRIVETAHEGIWCLDAESRTSFVNRRIEEILGYRAQDMIGRPLVDFLRPEDVSEHEAQFAARQQGRPGHFQRRYRHASGEWRWMSVSATPQLDEQGRFLGSFAMFTDITERKRAEEDRERLQAQLTQAQKMESVGRLAGGVAHDFNNMLQAILGNASLALLELPPDSPVRESLLEIQKSGLRSAELTRQLLTFARKQAVAPKVLDFNDTVAGMLKMLRRLIGEDIDLSWMPAMDLWSVKMDPSQIDQVLANLCVNARDAIAGTGRVTIETANVTLDDTYAATQPDCAAGDYVLLAVSDTGQGMDPETQSHLFEPFFTTKDVGKGTGLGLATVFGIVKQNHGLINVYSEPGQGTTFKIYFPRAEVEAGGAAPQAVRRAPRGTETVLVVEDEELVLNLGRRILEQQGYTVLAAPAPEAALAAAAQHAGPIHLLVTDVVMPGMNGKQLRDTLQALHPDLKCLFMSGYTADVIAHHGVLEEGVRFLQKPFTVQSLAEKVREALGSG